ncbi:MAG: choice-of-anchor L domain-containing protein [Hyphomicrobium sp.]
MAFTAVSSADELVTRLSSGAVGYTVVAGTTSFQGLTGGLGSVSLFDSISYGTGVLGPGALLTSGFGIPQESNTSTNYGTSLGLLGDANLTQVVQSTFNPSLTTNDATTLSFQINVTDASKKFVAIDLVFGSDEFPEFSNTNFVDVAGFFVNGKNYAFFSGNTNNPLSVLDRTIGNFQDNAAGNFAIQYDGVSTKLTIFAPVVLGINNIKIGVADTGDFIYDSGLFVSNLRLTEKGFAGTIKVVDAGAAINANNKLVGSNIDEFFNAGGGNDNCAGLGGNDIMDLGRGNDIGNGGSGNDTLIGDLGRDICTGGTGNDLFDYNSIKDSGKTKLLWDIIKDFKSKIDDLDLSTIDANTKAAGNNKFSFIGTKEFTNKAGQVRYEKESGYVLVEGDVNGDGKADFVIRLDKVVTLLKGDFIL